jgi:hypothetical protein
LLHDKRFVDAVVWLDDSDVDPDLVQREYTEASWAAEQKRRRIAGGSPKWQVSELF